MAKKTRSIKRKPGQSTGQRKSKRSRSELPKLADRNPPVENCHVEGTSGGWGVCVLGGPGRCTFPGIKAGGQTIQMILCETNGNAQLFLQEVPKKRVSRRTK